MIWLMTKGDKNAWLFELLPDYAADLAKKIKKAVNV
jgi:hypothetical protein